MVFLGFSFSSSFLSFSVTKFLVETGSLLHYSDQLGALNTLYFLDPAWLCDILVKVFTVGICFAYCLIV